MTITITTEGATTTMDKRRSGSGKGGFAPLLFSLFVILTSLLPLNSQDFSIGFSYNGTVSSNIFSNYEKIGDFINRGWLDFSLYPSRELEIYLSSGYSLFKENHYLNFLTLEMGGDWVKYLKGRSMIHFNAGINLQRFKSDYDYYNYYQPFLQGDFKYYLKNSLLFRASYSFEYTKFVYFPDYSNQKHRLFLQLNKFLPFEMTLRGEAGARLKFYTKDGSSIRQIYGRIRLSKGISYRIGLSGELTLKKNYVSESVPGKIEENFFFNTPFYDDFSWDGYWGFVQARAILLYEVEFTARASYYKRRFPRILALDLEGNPIQPLQDREDSLQQISVSLRRRWPSFQISLTYLYRTNLSNDPYFTFSDGIFMISTGIFVY